MALNKRTREEAIEMAAHVLETVEGDTHAALDAICEACSQDRLSDADAFWDHVAAIVETVQPVKAA